MAGEPPDTTGDDLQLFGELQLDLERPLRPCGAPHRFETTCATLRVARVGRREIMVAATLDGKVHAAAVESRPAPGEWQSHALEPFVAAVDRIVGIYAAPRRLSPHDDLFVAVAASAAGREAGAAPRLYRASIGFDPEDALIFQPGRHDKEPGDGWRCVLSRPGEPRKQFGLCPVASCDEDHVGAVPADLTDLAAELSSDVGRPLAAAVAGQSIYWGTDDDYVVAMDRSRAAGEREAARHRLHGWVRCLCFLGSEAPDGPARLLAGTTDRRLTMLTIHPEAADPADRFRRHWSFDCGEVPVAVDQLRTVDATERYVVAFRTGTVQIFEPVNAPEVRAASQQVWERLSNHGHRSLLDTAKLIAGRLAEERRYSIIDGARAWLAQAIVSAPPDSVDAGTLAGLLTEWPLVDHLAHVARRIARVLEHQASVSPARVAALYEALPFSFREPLDDAAPKHLPESLKALRWRTRSHLVSDVTANVNDRVEAWLDLRLDVYEQEGVINVHWLQARGGTLLTAGETGALILHGRRDTLVWTGAAHQEPWRFQPLTKVGDEPKYRPDAYTAAAQEGDPTTSPGSPQAGEPLWLPGGAVVRRLKTLELEGGDHLCVLAGQGGWAGVIELGPGRADLATLHEHPELTCWTATAIATSADVAVFDLLLSGAPGTFSARWRVQLIAGRVADRRRIGFRRILDAELSHADVRALGGERFRLAAVRATDGRVMVIDWDVSPGSPVAVPRVIDVGHRAVFTRWNRVRGDLYVGTDDGLVLAYDVQGDAPVLTWAYRAGRVIRAVDVSQEGDRVLVAAQPRGVAVLRHDGRRIWRIESDGNVSGVRWLPSDKRGARFAVMYREGRVHFFRASAPCGDTPPVPVDSARRGLLELLAVTSARVPSDAAALLDSLTTRAARLVFFTRLVPTLNLDEGRTTTLAARASYRELAGMAAAITGLDVCTRAWLWAALEVVLRPPPNEGERGDWSRGAQGFALAEIARTFLQFATGQDERREILKKVCEAGMAQPWLLREPWVRLELALAWVRCAQHEQGEGGAAVRALTGLAEMKLPPAVLEAVATALPGQPLARFADALAECMRWGQAVDQGVAESAGGAACAAVLARAIAEAGDDGVLEGARAVLSVLALPTWPGLLGLLRVRLGAEREAHGLVPISQAQRVLSDRDPPPGPRMTTDQERSWLADHQEAVPATPTDDSPWSDFLRAILKQWARTLTTLITARRDDLRRRTRAVIERAEVNRDAPGTPPGVSLRLRHEGQPASEVSIRVTLRVGPDPDEALVIGDASFERTAWDADAKPIEVMLAFHADTDAQPLWAVAELSGPELAEASVTRIHVPDAAFFDDRRRAREHWVTAFVERFEQAAPPGLHLVPVDDSATLAVLNESLARAGWQHVDPGLVPPRMDAGPPGRDADGLIASIWIGVPDAAENILASGGTARARALCEVPEREVERLFELVREKNRTVVWALPRTEGLALAARLPDSAVAAAMGAGAVWLPAAPSDVMMSGLLRLLPWEALLVLLATARGATEANEAELREGMIVASAPQALGVAEGYTISGADLSRWHQRHGQFTCRIMGLRESGLREGSIRRPAGAGSSIGGLLLSMVRSPVGVLHHLIRLGLVLRSGGILFAHAAVVRFVRSQPEHGGDTDVFGRLLRARTATLALPLAQLSALAPEAIALVYPQDQDRRRRWLGNVAVLAGRADGAFEAALADLLEELSATLYFAPVATTDGVLTLEAMIGPEAELALIAAPRSHRVLLPAAKAWLTSPGRGLRRSVIVLSSEEWPADTPPPPRVVWFGPDSLATVVFSARPATRFWAVVRGRLETLDISPFSHGGALPAGSGGFVGRRAERDLLTENAGLRTFLILGARQIGKTSLLNAIEGDLHNRPEAVSVVRLEFQGKRDAAGVHSALNAVLTGGQGTADERLGAWAREARRTGRCPVCLMNEIDALLEHAPDVLWALRGLSDRGELHFIMTGYGAALWALDDLKSPLFHWTHGLGADKAILLGPLAASDAREIVRRLEMEPCELTWAERERDEATAHLIDRSFGIPWVLQRLCLGVLERVTRAGRDVVFFDDVRAVVAGSPLLDSYDKSRLGSLLGLGVDRESFDDAVARAGVASCVKRLYFDTGLVDEPGLGRQPPPAFSPADFCQYLLESLPDFCGPVERDLVETALRPYPFSRLLDALTLTNFVVPETSIEGHRQYAFTRHILPLEIRRAPDRKNPVKMLRLAIQDVSRALPHRKDLPGTQP